MKIKTIKISETEVCPNGHKNCLSARCYVDKPKLKKEDFNVSINWKGYMISYKGKNIGGAGIDTRVYSTGYKKEPNYKIKQANVRDYTERAKRDIENLIAGRGNAYMVEVIEEIRKGNK